MRTRRTGNQRYNGNFHEEVQVTRYCSWQTTVAGIVSWFDFDAAINSAESAETVAQVDTQQLQRQWGRCGQQLNYHGPQRPER